VAAWNDVGAPKKTPPDIIDKLNKEINAALADPKLKMRLAELGSSVVGGSPADYGRLLAEEAEKWGKVIRAANIKAEWRRYAGYSISPVLRTTRL
jgi:tripartite-type tricarboxylate transporter receptor subunit TctC